MFKGRLILPALMVLALAAPINLAQAQTEEALTLDQAYDLVLKHNPQVRGYLAKISAAEGERIQESLMPNPEAIFEVENFGGDSPRNGLSAAEYTLGIEQQVEIAGKRNKREAVASLEKQRVSQEALATIQGKLAQTKAAYMRVAIAQERLALARKRMDVADRTHSTVKRRINAAKSADIEHTKADIEVSTAEVEERKAVKELDIAKTALANLMGEASLSYAISPDLTTLPDPPEEAVVWQAIEQSPLQVMSRVAVMREEAALNLAEANSVADPTFGLGVRRFAEDDGSAFLASVSIPLTFFDRNQGAIAKARADVQVAHSDREVMRLSLNKQATELWQTLISAREEVMAYQDGLLPSARKAYTQAETGFDRGAFSFLDLLDAQRTLYEVQESHLDALASFYDSKAQLDMLTGEYSALAASAFNIPVNEKE